MGEEEWGLREESISGPVKRGSGKARPVMNHLVFGFTME